MKLKKYCLHDMSGTYLHFTTNSLEKAIETAEEYTFPVQVSEKYQAPSSWNQNKMTEHFKPVHYNKHWLKKVQE